MICTMRDMWRGGGGGGHPLSSRAVLSLCEPGALGRERERRVFL